MFEKRFSHRDSDDWEILDNGKHFAYAHSGYQAENIIGMLNDLDTFRDAYFDLGRQIKQLKDENHRLRLIMCDLDSLNFDIEWLKEHLGEWKR